MTRLVRAICALVPARARRTAIRDELASLVLFSAEQGAALTAAGQVAPPHDVSAVQRELEGSKREVEAAEKKVEAAEQKKDAAEQKVHAPAQNPPAQPPGPYKPLPR